jgi:hypothetical protein
MPPPPKTARTVACLRSLLEMCEAGDDIVGATPQSLALRADLKRQIAALENAQAIEATPPPSHATAA